MNTGQLEERIKGSSDVPSILQAFKDAGGILPDSAELLRETMQEYAEATKLLVDAAEGLVEAVDGQLYDVNSLTIQPLRQALRRLREVGVINE